MATTEVSAQAETKPARSTRSILGGTEEARDHLPILRWLLLNCVAVVAFLALWRLGLLRAMIETDRTRISTLILVLLALMILHCLHETVAVSRELAATRRIAARLARGGASRFETIDGRVSIGPGEALEPSILTRHIGNLIVKSVAQSGRPIDQTLLLRALADRLRARERLGWFVSDALLRLALLGTAVGFILMLIPIAGLSSFEVDILRGALAGMSAGMAVALNVTVAGIAAALLLKFEYYLLDQAIGELFANITEITETRVVPALGNAAHG